MEQIPATSDDTAAAPQKSPQEVARQWLASVEQAKKAYDKFQKRGDHITKRYRAERGTEGPSSAGTKFNLFWSNVQTLGPATYSRRPRVEVYRRFRDSDPVARLASQILQRALQYEVDCTPDLHETLKACVLDRLLPGQGVAWVRYEPSFKTEPTEVPNPADPTQTLQEDMEALSDERTPTDYVFWKDFLCSPARTWADVRWVSRRVMFSKDALTKRFQEPCARLGGDVTLVPCNYDPTQLNEDRPKAGDEGDPTLSRALIWEIWDKESKQLFWVCQGYEFPLDIQDDPAQLDGFFPCPQPLWATMTNDTLIPVADFVVYSDQLRELDDISTRISLLTSALRVIGVYDASQTALSTLLQSGVENRMVPVNSWAAFAEKGGLKGTMDFLPLEQVFAVLEGLQKAREALKQTIYEITGMADIVRGATVASETLGAQQIKAKFANLRLSSRQQQVAEFVTHILRIKAEWMCELYSPETLIRISSVEQLLEVQKDLQKVSQIQAQALAAQVPPGMPPPAPQPVTDPAQSPLVQAALKLLKDERVRKYRIDVASDSMIELDEVDERERRNEFMSAVSNFMNAMKNVTAVGPEMVPVALEMLKFVVRGFSVGRSLESCIEDAVEAVEKRMANPQPPAPDSTLLMKKEIEGMKIASDERLAALDADTKKDLGELKASTDLVIHDLQQQQAALQQKLDQVHQGAMAADQQEGEAQSSAQAHAQTMEQQAAAPQPAGAGLQGQPDNQQALGQAVKALLEHLAKPRIRRVGGVDAQGNITHVIDEPAP